jgi:NAD(P)-dependent dehydrogenase (short-subunit alcohol dehydrogenase family)
MAGKLMDGKVVVITGAGRGVGRAHALRFASEGAKIVVNDLGIGVTSAGDGTGVTEPDWRPDVSVAQHVVAEIEAAGGEAVADHSDLSTFAGGRQLIAAALDAFGQVDSLINNAGTMTIMRVGEVDEAKLVRELAVHVVGYIGTIEAVWRHMVGRGGGTIVNTASGFGGAGPGLIAYMAAKSGVFSLTRDVALEGARHGIRCNAVTPAARTRMSTPYWGADQTEDWDPNWASTVALYLASPLSAEVTGRQLGVVPANVLHEYNTSGGMLMNDVEWTPEAIAERVGELLQKAPDASPLRLPPLLDDH